jgi:DNA-binding XRE family transcriptional regulator
MSTREELRSTLPVDREYRHAYADEILNLLVCSQIRVLREQQEMTQGQLGETIGTTQTAISRIENTNYSAWNIRTLKKIAEAFDLRLRITFENFGTLWQDVRAINYEGLRRAKNIQEDPEFTASAPVQVPAIVEGSATLRGHSALIASGAVLHAPSVAQSSEETSDDAWIQFVDDGTYEAAPDAPFLETTYLAHAREKIDYEAETEEAA